MEPQSQDREQEPSSDRGDPAAPSGSDYDPQQPLVDPQQPLVAPESGQLIPAREPEQAGDSDPWQLRAADSDRDAYVAVLQAAYVDGRLSRVEYDERMAAALAAATYAQLRPLVADLPLAPGSVPGPPLPVPRTAPPAPATPSGRRVGNAGVADQPPVIAVLSETKREGRWVVADGSVAVAVLGSVKLDLSSAAFAAAAVEIRANAILGSIEIEVPDDIRVEMAGVGVLGEFSHKGSAAQPDAADIVVTVSGVALMGSVTVTTVPGPPREDRSVRSIAPPAQ